MFDIILLCIIILYNYLFIVELTQLSHHLLKSTSSITLDQIELIFKIL